MFFSFSLSNELGDDQLLKQEEKEEDGNSILTETLEQTINESKPIEESVVDTELISSSVTPTNLTQEQQISCQNLLEIIPSITDSM